MNTSKKLFVFDLTVFTAIFLAIVLLWNFYFGVFYDHLIPSFDALAYLIDTSLMKDINFNFEEYLYRYEILGGTQIYDIYGMVRFFQFYKLIQFLDLHPVTMFNTYIMFFQLMLGYFGSKSVVLFRKYFYGGELEHDYKSILIGILFSFMPLLGLRILHGHVNNEFISIPLFFVVILGFQYKAFSILDLILVSCGLFILSPPNGQIAVYVATFPLLIYLSMGAEIYRNGDRKKLFQSILFLVVAVIGCSLISLPELLERLNFLRSPDALRSLSSTGVVYSYTTHTWQDLVASFTFMLEPFITRQNTFLLHETNYAVGPLFAVIVLMPLRKHKLFFSAFFITLICILGFSMNISPIQDMVMGVIPLLKSFRVPARSISIIVIITFILATAYFLEKCDFKQGIEKFKTLNPGVQILSVAGLIALLFIPPYHREIFFFTYLIAFFVISFREKEKYQVLKAFVIPVITVCAISAFGERYKESGLKAEKFNEYKEIGNEIKKVFPSLNSPLSRVSPVGDLGKFYFNVPLAMGLSAIDGYRLPHKRFIYTLNPLRGQPATEVELSMYYPPTFPNYDLVRKMYNINGVLLMDAGRNKVDLKLLNKESKPIWFSDELKTESNIMNVVGDAKENFYKRAYVLEKVSSDIFKDYSSCKSSLVENVDAKFNDQNINVKVRTEADCPMIVSTNYTEKIQAYASGSDKPLVKFPVWGSLAGFIVPKGSTEIMIKPKPTYPAWADALSWVGWLILILNMMFAARELFIPLLPRNSRNSA